MITIKKYTPFFASALLMYIIVSIIYPYYKYYIDPDGTAYLTIAQRYATGDYAKAINGYWSPWSCWLTALLIKTGIAAIPASIIVNTIGGLGFLSISQSLFIKFNIATKIQYWLNYTIALFLCFAIFWQSFDDLWECFFLLCTIRLMLAEQFTQKPFLWVSMGFIGALAYFAKAYSFPFFILNTFCCIGLLTQGNLKQWFKLCLVSIGVMFLVSLPWLYLLHRKYGIYTTSTAGTLNMSWYLVGHPHWQQGIKWLLPPVYNDSPYYWEDPYIANADTPHFWDSFPLSGLQLLRIVLNVYKFIFSILQISVFFPIILFYVVKCSLSNTYTIVLQQNLRLLSISLLLFPLGYLLINFESRYLWFMLPLGMLFGVLIIKENFIKYKLSSNILIFIFLLSFLIYPSWQMIHLYNEGKQEFLLAQQLKAIHINGSFTSNRKPRYMARLAYFSGNPYYYNAQAMLANNKINDSVASLAHFDSLLVDMRKYKVQYFFNFSGKEDDNNPNLHFSINDTTKKLKLITRINDLEIIQIL